MCDPYSAWRIEPWADFHQRPISDQLLHLVGWAVLAPSSHNSQPWLFTASPAKRSIWLQLDPTCLLAESDAVNRQATMSAGCAVEALAIAAQAYGLDTSIDLAPSATNNGEPVLARVRLGPTVSDAVDPAQARQAFAALRGRRMNRSKYTAQPVPDDIVNGLNQAAERYGVSVDLVGDKATRIAISELQYMADRAVIALPGFRRELAGYFMPDRVVSWRGMPGSTFGLSETTAEQIQNDLGRDGLFNPDWAAGFAAANRDGIRSAPLLVVVSTRRDDAEHWLRAGRYLQHAALLAERNGLAVAVHAALVESRGLSNLLRLRLRRKHRPNAVFRMGYALEERGHSPRLRAEQVTVVDSGPARSVDQGRSGSSSGLHP